MLVGIGIGGFIIFIFGIIGALMIFMYFRQKKEAEESQNWASTLGRITKTYMRQEVSYETGSTLYYPEIEYEYEYRGVIYTGNRIDFGGSSGNSNHNKSEELLAQYPINKTITVYYDPNNPEEAVLEQKMGTGGKVMLIVGILFAFIALCAIAIASILAISIILG